MHARISATSLAIIAGILAGFGCTSAIGPRDGSHSDVLDAMTLDGAGDVNAIDVANPSDAEAGRSCTSDFDCSDMVFCDGVERCMPGAPGANARGCLTASPTNPCMPSQTCNESMQRCDTVCTTSPDADHDGHRAISCGGDDCDDADANRFPGNIEVCALDATGGTRLAPTHDEDCDPHTVSNSTTSDGDHDGDGHVDSVCCNVDAAGHSNCGDDCDDLTTQHGLVGTAAATTVDPGEIHPMQSEVCDGVDNNCNGMIDEGVRQSFYPDCDGDGFGDMSSAGSMGCFPTQFPGCMTHPPVVNHSDCDDSNANVHPGAPEICDAAMLDENCDGMRNEGCACIDGSSIACGSSMPGCTMGLETCVMGHLGMCSVSTTVRNCYLDGDRDGFAGAGAAVVSMACVCPVRTTSLAPSDAVSTDCNDANMSVHPGATEVCNGVDDNCNAAVDEGVALTFYRDCDGDAFGDQLDVGTMGCDAASLVACMGHVPVSNHTDCDDTRAASNPGATELCDVMMLDENCNGLHNEGCTCIDGSTVPCGTSLPGCSMGTETCSGGMLGACSVSTAIVTCYTDADGDSYAPAGARTQLACACPIGTTSRAPSSASTTDCDDSNGLANPGATEICNGVDDNCDGSIDEGLTTTCYVDIDRDSFAPFGALASQRCGPTVGTCPAGYTSRVPTNLATTDCNDASMTVHPGVAESCNGIDDNCNGLIDEGVNQNYYSDCDGDLFGDVMDPGMPGCTPSQFAPCMGHPAVTNHTDCDDTRATVNPGASEVCDAAMLDENCNGMHNEGCTCVNGSTVPCGSSLPGCTMGTQTCTAGAYGACSVATPAFVTCYADSDGDGYAVVGAATNQACACAARTTARTPANASSIDCDDTRANCYPGAAEVCDSVDNNCNGLIDEGLTITCYVDFDRDTFAPASAVAVPLCPPSPGSCPTGYTAQLATDATNTDCNDMNFSVNPGITEICNGIDDNCNGAIDENLTSASCTVGVGACANTGFLHCDATTCSVTAGTPDSTYHATAAANGSWDWNCDGCVRQEHLTGSFCHLTTPGVLGCATAFGGESFPNSDNTVVHNAASCAPLTVSCGGTYSTCNCQSYVSFGMPVCTSYGCGSAGALRCR